MVGLAQSRTPARPAMCGQISGWARRIVEGGAAEKHSAEFRTATTDADRGSPSMIDSSPTMAPGPKKARMRSVPARETMVTLSSPSSMR